MLRQTADLEVDGTIVGAVAPASGPLDRFFGLMGRSRIPGDRVALWFPRCSGLHTFFMRFPLDIVYVRDGRIIRVVTGVPPFRFTWGGRGADALELPAGAASRLGLHEGARVAVRAQGADVRTDLDGRR